jgi:hypothetical protein
MFENADQPTSLSSPLVLRLLTPSSTVSPGAYIHHQHQPFLTRSHPSSTISGIERDYASSWVSTKKSDWLLLGLPQS